MLFCIILTYVVYVYKSGAFLIPHSYLATPIFSSWRVCTCFAQKVLGALVIYFILSIIELAMVQVANREMFGCGGMLNPRGRLLWHCAGLAPVSEFYFSYGLTGHVTLSRCILILTSRVTRPHCTGAHD
jgi:hypothetical protein